MATGGKEGKLCVKLKMMRVKKSTNGTNISVGRGGERESRYMCGLMFVRRKGNRYIGKTKTQRM